MSWDNPIFSSELKEALLKRNRSIYRDSLEYDAFRYIEHLEAELATLESENAWHRVEEGLPEPNTKVLFWSPTKELPFWILLKFNREKWDKDGYAKGTKDAFTHWRYIQPPEKERK